MNNPTPEQINRELAEIAGLIIKGNKIIPGLITWSPTTDLNQIFKYLLPVLGKKKSMGIREGRRYWKMAGVQMFQYTIKILSRDFSVEIEKKTDDPDKIPATICKAVLEAWEKIK